MSDMRDPEVSRRYREASVEAPPVAPGDALRAAAAAAVVAAPRVPARRRWGAPLALAASVVLGLGLVLRVAVERPDLRPSAQEVLPAPASAPAPAPAPASAGAPAVAPAPEFAKEKKQTADPAALDPLRQAMPTQTAPPLMKREVPSTAADRMADADVSAPSRRLGESAAKADASANASIAAQAAKAAAVPDAPPRPLGGAITPPASLEPPASQAPMSVPPPMPATKPAPAPGYEARPAIVQAIPPAPPAAASRPFPAPAKPAASVPQGQVAERESRDAGNVFGRSAPAADAQRSESGAGASASGIDARARSAERQDSAMQKTVAEEIALTPADWIRRIVELRRAGRHADADASLRRFVERYPTFRVPDEARAP